MVPEFPERGDGGRLLGGDDPRAALREFASSEDLVDEWLKERGREVYAWKRHSRKLRRAM